MLKFDFDKNRVAISITEHDSHFDFLLQAKDSEMETNIKKVRDIMEGDDDPVDVNFLAFSDNRFEVFVRKDAFTDFMLQLFKYNVITSLTQ